MIQGLGLTLHSLLRELYSAMQWLRAISSFIFPPYQVSFGTIPLKVLGDEYFININCRNL